MKDKVFSPQTEAESAGGEQQKRPQQTGADVSQLKRPQRQTAGAANEGQRSPQGREKAAEKDSPRAIALKEEAAAWRKKARDFHPDQVRGAGLSEEFVRYANEQLQKINEAYEKICKDRGIT